MAIELSSNMKNDIKVLYGDIYNVLAIHCRFNELSMNLLQGMGFNGFKRMHRYNSRVIHDLKLCLCNELYDKFNIISDFKVDDVTYSVKTIEEHLKSYNDALLDAIEKLGLCNKRFFELTGLRCDIVDKALCLFVNDYTKVNRYYRRFSSTDWLMLDVHIVDDKLHERYKELENGCKK